MNTKLVSSILITAIIASMLAVFAAGAEFEQQPIETLGINEDVATSIGTFDLIDGTKVGGSPSNYITLTSQVTLDTINGPETFTIGTKIDCDYEPPAEDPCDPG